MKKHMAYVHGSESLPGSANHATLSGVALVKKVVLNLPASVGQRLLNFATEDFGLVLTRYGLEGFLFRLTASAHRDSFVLKGALLLQVWTGETYRPTRDLDLLGTAMSNVSYMKIFSEICS